MLSQDQQRPVDHHEAAADVSELGDDAIGVVSGGAFPEWDPNT